MRGDVGLVLDRFGVRRDEGVAVSTKEFVEWCAVPLDMPTAGSGDVRVQGGSFGQGAEACRGLETEHVN